jgi:hypothetical protein
VLSVFSNAAKIAGRFVFGAAAAPLVPAVRTGCANPVPALWETDARLKENFQLLGDDAKKTYQETWCAVGTEKYKRLFLAIRSYSSIAKNADRLSEMLGGGVGGASAATLMTELRKEIDADLASDFLGAKTKDQWSPAYEITPAWPATDASYTLFQLSACGISAETAQPVRNPLDTLKCEQPATSASELKLTVKTASGQPPARANEKPAEGALYYVRPEAVLIELEGTCAAGAATTACNVAAQPALLAQWGVEAALPAAGSWSYTVSLYEATGALKTIKLSSKAALSPATIDSAFGVANTLLDAKAAADAAAQKKAAAAAAASDELTKLTRAREILEEQAKIRALCQDLNQSTCEY